MVLTLERDHNFEPIKKRKRYKGCFKRRLNKNKKTKNMLPFEREHQKTRGKETDCDMYEGVCEIASQHGEKNSCFYTQM